MDIKTISAKVIAGNYLVRDDAIQHALKEGFNRQNMVDAILVDPVIEGYPNGRVLICGRLMLNKTLPVCLHVICDCSDPTYIEFVTAFIPDELASDNPLFKTNRRPRKRKR